MLLPYVPYNISIDPTIRMSLVSNQCEEICSWGLTTAYNCQGSAGNYFGDGVEDEFEAWVGLEQEMVGSTGGLVTGHTRGVSQQFGEGNGI